MIGLWPGLDNQIERGNKCLGPCNEVRLFGCFSLVTLLLKWIQVLCFQVRICISSQMILVLVP